jgi:hypothetical protein
LASTAAAGSTVCRSADCDVVLPAVQETLTVAQRSNFIFCRPPRNENEEVVVNYYVEAKIGDKSADPKRSNVVSAKCSAAEGGERPPVEIPEGFNP